MVTDPDTRPSLTAPPRSGTKRPMRFASPLVPARLIRRYKRFLADVILDSGEEITAHVANSGSMMGLAPEGARVWLSHSNNPKRKLAYGWELVEVDVGKGLELVGINTGHPNGLVQEAILDGTIAELAGYSALKREVAYGEASRVDMVLTDAGRPPCYVEVKNVHLMRQPGLAEFPDCVTARGAKHLGELAAQVAKGDRAVMVFLIQYGGAERFSLARDLDPAYGRAFDAARSRGVEMLAYRCRLSRDAIVVERAIPIAE